MATKTEQPLKVTSEEKNAAQTHRAKEETGCEGDRTSSIRTMDYQAVMTLPIHPSKCHVV